MRTITWSANDRKAFGDGNRLRASAIPGRRFNGPAISEWDDSDDTPLFPWKTEAGR
jgi:hypothetical protein